MQAIDLPLCGQTHAFSSSPAQPASSLGMGRIEPFVSPAEAASLMGVASDLLHAAHLSGATLVDLEKALVTFGYSSVSLRARADFCLMQALLECSRMSADARILRAGNAASGFLPEMGPERSCEEPSSIRRAELATQTLNLLVDVGNLVHGLLDVRHLATCTMCHSSSACVGHLQTLAEAFLVLFRECWLQAVTTGDALLALFKAAPQEACAQQEVLTEMDDSFSLAREGLVDLLLRYHGTIEAMGLPDRPMGRPLHGRLEKDKQSPLYAEPGRARRNSCPKKGQEEAALQAERKLDCACDALRRMGELQDCVCSVARFKAAIRPEPMPAKRPRSLGLALGRGNA